MPSCLYLTDPYTHSSKEVEIDLSSTLGHFKDVVAQHTGISPQEQDLIYLGDCLCDSSNTLTSLGIKDSVTIFVLKRPEKKIEDEPPIYQVSLSEVQQYLAKGRNSMSVQSIRDFIKRNENIEKVISENEAIKNDPVTTNLLRDPDLLLSIIESGTADSIVRDYPLLALALQQIIPKASAHNVRNALLPSDDDEGEYDGIDLSHLAQAELMASGSGSSSSARQQRTPTQQPQQQISAVDLANALSFATMTQPVSGSSQSNQLSDSEMEEALQQMRAVGIDDDSLSRRALIISQGNVETAINMIFEGSLS